MWVILEFIIIYTCRLSEALVKSPTCVPVVSACGPRQIRTEGLEQVKERPCNDDDVGGGTECDD